MKENKNDVVEQKRKKKSEPVTVREVIRMSIVSGFILLATLFIFHHVLMLSLIPSGSMEGTIMTGDMVIATRYDTDEIDRYDIVVFIPPDNPDAYYIKRVIGLSGETILVYDGEVYADGVKLDSFFVPEKREEMVTENMLFLMDATL